MPNPATDQRADVRERHDETSVATPATSDIVPTPLRLGDFIAANSEAILAEWVAFAATCGPAGGAMDLASLRDHAVAMLATIVKDLRTRQTASEQTEKSKGNANPVNPGQDTAAEVHGAGRAESGFTIGQMVSEYRALRASVIRLWTTANGSLAGSDIGDLMRFNEAIDQALAESITRYTLDLDYSKEMFLAILGHDLRTPLGAVISASQFMLDTGDLTEPNLALTTRIVRSSRRMNDMVGDLLDFTLSRLGSGVPIVRKEMDMGVIAYQAVEEVRVARPDSLLRFTSSGALGGRWDAARISQMLVNLLSNAVQHGAAKTTVDVRVQGEASEVTLRVHNQGPTIPAAELPELFSPLKRLKSPAPKKRQTTNIGLGLYIAERIVTAHGGTIGVTSTAQDGTTVTVSLPR